MTHIDLLNYLTDVQKIEKADLAELIGIPQKKIDGVLCGQVSLKKKWLKNLSLYTNIPTDAILTGNFALEYPQTPDGETEPVIADPYVPEAIREENTKRLNFYSKKRYKTFYQDVVMIQLMGIIGVALSWIAPLVLMLAYSIVAASDLFKIMLLGIIPAMLSVSIIRNVYKFTKKGVPADEKTFKYYAVLSVIQIVFFTISLVVFEWVSPIALVAAVLTAVPIIYQAIIAKDNELSYLKNIVISIICVAMFIPLALFFFTGEKFDALENEEQIISSLGLFCSGWLSTYYATASIIVCKYYYSKKKIISKHFGPINKKKIFKNCKIAKSIISLILVGTVIYSVIYVAPVIAFDKIFTSATSFTGEEINEPECLDYDKTDIFFAENEEVVVIEQENYSFKLPAYMERDTEAEMSEIYRNMDKMSSLIIDEEYLDYEEIMSLNGEEEQKEFSEMLRNSITERYGFFPKSEYEFYKLMDLIFEDTINPFNRDLSIAVSTLKGMALMSANEKVYLYEDSERCLCVRINCFEREDGKISYFYNISGNKKGDYDKFFCFTMVSVSNVSDMDLPFKIINSIEMK